MYYLGVSDVMMALDNNLPEFTENFFYLATLIHSWVQWVPFASRCNQLGGIKKNLRNKFLKFIKSCYLKKPL